MTASDTPDRTKLLAELHADRKLAHEVLFHAAHRHASPPFHDRLVDDLHSPAPRVLIEMFRGSAKSTRAEEAAVLAVLFGEAHNVVFVGDSFPRAVDRVRSVRKLLHDNEMLQWLFGYEPNPNWGETKLVLENGACIQALGQGQAIRGMKHGSYRPDLVIVDDLEDEETVANPDSLKKLTDWFFASLEAALDVDAKLRVLATPLAPDCLPELLKKAPGWVARRVPIWYLNDDGERVASWPDRYPLVWCDNKRDTLYALGKGTTWHREYMVEAVSEEEQVFRGLPLLGEPVVRKPWHPVRVMYDPARTVGPRSAWTGKAVWSWENDRLLVWETSGRSWLPDAIVKDVFETNAKYAPVEIGIEVDGLEEFATQPIEAEMARRGVLIPLEPARAPRRKLDFIRQLQPFFKAGNIVLVGGPEAHPDLVAGLDSFPTGRIDVPNALAYALLKRATARYALSPSNIEGAREGPEDRWLVADSDGVATWVALVRVPKRGPIHVIADDMEEGSPLRVVPDMIRGWTAVGPIERVVLPLDHFSTHDTIGLRAAFRRLGLPLLQGGDTALGEGALRELLEGKDAFAVGTPAVWTIRALIGGLEDPAPRTRLAARYALVGRGLAAFAARFAGPRSNSRARRVGPDGREYFSALTRM